MVVDKENSTEAALPLAEQAHRRLKARILNNELMPGQQVLERDLIEELGMSRTPIREAMVRLQDEGLVQIVPRHGMKILALKIEDMAEIYEILTALEGVAAARLASLAREGLDISDLEDAMDDMEKSLAADDLNAWAEADNRYHFLLLKYCGNGRLAQICDDMQTQIYRARMITLNMRKKPVRSNEEHRAILIAIQEGDAEKAAQLYRAHRDRASSLLIDLLKNSHLQQL